MTAALSLYKKYGQDELLRMQASIEADPACRNTKGGIHMYEPRARRKLSDIAQAITFHMADRRAEAGRPVPADGYSGRNQNRQR